MKTFKQFVESKNDFIGYHNTETKIASRIRAAGFKLQKKAKRKRLYGNGIYFTNEPNNRWGPVAIKVELKPKNPLVDISGQLSYEGNPIGDEVEAIGKTLFKSFHMSDAVKRALAIEKYLNDNGIDMLITDEMGKTIYVVRDESIITIIEGD
jgi:hypothetical protein